MRRLTPAALVVAMVAPVVVGAEATFELERRQSENPYAPKRRDPCLTVIAASRGYARSQRGRAPQGGLPTGRGHRC